jgi:uncharacterized iron-regulated protein
VHHEEIIEERGSREEHARRSATQSATFSRAGVHESARTRAVRRLAEDIARAHAEGDAMTARALTHALSVLVGLDADKSHAGDVIDIERARKKGL